MVLFCLLRPSLLFAQDELRIVLVDAGSPELARKVRAEAMQAGFTVSEHEEGQSLAHVAIVSGEQVEVTIPRRGDEPPFSQKLARRAGEGDSFALRVIEELRARLIELEIVEESRFAAQPTAPAPAPAPAAEPAPAPEQRAPAPAPEPAPELDAHWKEPPIQREPGRFWLRAGGGATFPDGGIGATPQVALGLAYEDPGGFGVGGRALLPLTDNRVSAAEGDADVNVNLFTASLEFRPPVWKEWLVGAELGGGALLLAMQAEPEPSYVGKEEQLVSGLLFASVGAGRSLSDWLRLRASVMGGASAPRPVLSFVGRDVAAWGRMFAALTLELEATLPSGGSR